MIYPTTFEAKLGFDAIRGMLASKCEGVEGRRLVAEMEFLSDFSCIDTMLRQTAEMKSILEGAVERPQPGFYDIGAWLPGLRASGAYASASDLLQLLRTLESFGSVRRFYCAPAQGGAGWRFKSLAVEFSRLEEFPELAAELSRCINKFGEVKDNASDELYEVRRQLSSAQGSVQRAVRKVLDRAVAAGIVEKDTTPSLRDGRMVIPVSASRKRSISGIVHDESATGKTVFIEPAEVVEAGNRIRELEMEERRQVVIVLTRLADVVRPHIDAILFSSRLLGLLDFITAKARFAIETGGEMPVLERKPEIDWYHAVHPQLLLTLRTHGREPVALYLKLDRRQRFLIISGPNAGGKSVCLKTVGTVQYMMQCGMLPTLHSNSHMGVFENIFVDIGDEQSIENDLSTYSSHLRNMRYFLTHSNRDTLVLADEMGSGTEPQIGGALAQAILASLARDGCFGVVTTHYQNLKTFADETDGFVNGAMLYDRERMQPTFELSVGNPGSSFALEIARKVGLPPIVVEQAKDIVGSDYVNADKFMLDLARDRKYWHNKRLSIREKEAKLDALLARYEDTSADLRSQRNQILHDARREAKEILATANARIESTIKGIRDAQAEKERTMELRRNLEEYKRELAEEGGKEKREPAVLQPLRHKSRTARQKQKQPAAPAAAAPMAAGDYVRMADGGVTGRIISIQGKRAEVAFGALRTTTELSKLVRAQKPKESATSTVVTSGSTTESRRRRQLDFKREIDVRGFRADEALQAVTYFIDDALQFGADRVRILHGTGHGILKTLIRQMLATNPGVRSCTDEDVRFGGAGITVVDLD